MTPLPRLIAAAVFVTFAVALLAPTWADDRPPRPPAKDGSPPESAPGKKAYTYPPGATVPQKQEIDLLRVRDWSADPAMRKKLLAAYPFESLEGRLRYDGPGRKRLTNLFPTAVDPDQWKPFLRTGQATKIPPAALATLMADERLDREGHFERMRALASLHRVEVQKFVTNPGFGNIRLVSQRFDGTAEEPPTDWSEGDRGEPVDLPATGGFFSAGRDKNGPTLPSLLALAGLHASTAHEFARPDSWGLVKDRTQVAGFRPHALEFAPDGYARRRLDQEHPVKDEAGRVTGYPLVERWAVRRVELIGLLVHDAPVVYLNPEGQLPAMAAVKDAKTRELTEFESGGLKDLAAGKEVVAVDAVANQVRMVGAIRMAGGCVKCHEGKRGDLLGAFTYDLVRVPAFVPAHAPPPS
jgi:hypothetical protein